MKNMLKSKLLNYKENRPWGFFRKFCENTKVSVKIITVNPKQSLSLQMHNKREEFWRVLKGKGIAEVDGKKIKIKSGDEIVIPIKTKHRLTAGLVKLEILEISFGEFVEDDIVRYEDIYNRK